MHDSYQPRVLIIAEAANPEWTSVPLVGWSHSRAIGRLTRAHIVTQVRNRDAFLRQGMVEGQDFTAIDSEAVAGPMWRTARWLRGGQGRGWTTVTAVNSLSYYFFEHLVWKTFAEDIAARRYDIVHRLTPLSPVIPSPIAKKCRRAGVPFVLGPINGGLPWPKQFDQARRKEGERLSKLRGLHKLLPGYRSTRNNASVIIVASRHTWSQTPRKYHQNCAYIPENGINPEHFSLHRRGPAHRPLKVVFLGRLVPCKGVDMLVEAAAPLARSGAIKLTIIGDGPMKEQLRQMVASRGAESGIELLGHVAHADVPRCLSEADVLAFPGIHEFGGGAVLEAMAVGLASVVVDYGGPGELVTPECGVLVPMGSREEIVSQFRSRLSELADHPEVIESMGVAARCRVLEKFTWDAKARQVLGLYKRILESSSEKNTWEQPPWSAC